MATDAELTAAGIHLPVGNDYISEGDNAISANARVLWDRIGTGMRFRGYLDEQTGTLADLKRGFYEVRYVGTAVAWGLPQDLIGLLYVDRGELQTTIIYRPNDAAAGAGTKSWWEISTDSEGVLRDRWQRGDKSILTSKPVVLTAPAGEYPQTDSRGAVRLPFTVPTDVHRVRVHMRPWNYRTGKTWGPARLDGVMIAQQDSGGTITGSRWYAEDAPGVTVSGTAGWTSDWFHVSLTEGNTFLLSYAADWQDDVRDLVLGTCWSNFDLSKWDSTELAVYENGWGGFGLQPMDVWIECEAPANVPTYGFFGASNTMGMDSGDPVFGAYPTVYAREHGAFCALTAAGGWSIMDDTAHDLDLMRRFGYPARMLDRVYLDWGSNIEIRGATAPEAIAKLEYWMDRQLNGLGNPPVYMTTQVAGPTITDTGPLSGTLSDWNQWVRFTSTLRPEVVGMIDFAAIFADPDKPWTARPELRASAGNVHFNAAGQKMRAQALAGTIQLPSSSARNAAELTAPDTDWRNVTGALVNGWTADRVEVRRKDDRTILRFTNLNGSAATDSYFVHGMRGFFAGGQNLPVNVGAGMHFLWINPAGTSLSLSTSTPPSAITTTATQYVGDLTWPTVYPGIPG